MARQGIIKTFWQTLKPHCAQLVLSQKSPSANGGISDLIWIKKKQLTSTLDSDSPSTCSYPQHWDKCLKWQDSSQNRDIDMP